VPLPRLDFRIQGLLEFQHSCRPNVILHLYVTPLSDTNIGMSQDALNIRIFDAQGMQICR
jgi:hypothetical protein